jgi:phospho-N-acetylmuramoyl-pentapeptide-transferase
VGVSCASPSASALIGFLDDYDKVKKRHHKGMSGRVGCSPSSSSPGIGCCDHHWGGGTELYFPFYNTPLVNRRPALHFVRAFVVGAPSAMRCNLTDGLDGLATMR